MLLAACKGGQEQETSGTADTTAPAESVTDPAEVSSDPAQTEQGTQNGGEESGTPGDGCYHMGSEDGPVVLINLGDDSLYMDALTTVCGNMRLGVYVYGEDGNLLSKDSYNELIWAYDAVSDGGYYPPDDTLVDMLKTVGDYIGWYDPASPMYLFEGVALEPANAFLFACVYLK